MSINYDLYNLSFPDLIGESRLFKDFWIVRTSRTMTKYDFMDILYLERRAEMKKLLQLMIVLSLCVLWFSIVEGEDWRLFCRNIDFYYYDNGNINRPYDKFKNIVSVWQRIIYQESSVNRIVDHLGPKYEDLAESISLIEIDCSTKNAWTKSVVFYGSKDRIIDTTCKTKENWNLITPETPLDKLYKAVCPQKKTADAVSHK